MNFHKRLAESGRQFGQLVDRPSGLFVFGIYDAISAKAAVLAQCETLYLGGYAASAVRGFPDFGIMTMSEVVQHVKFIARFVDVPLIVDIDDGYGGINNVIRTAEEILMIPGVAAIHLEDQHLPKRCGHIAGKAVLPISEYLGKLKAVLDVRDALNPHCKVIARTDAFSASGGKKDPDVGGDSAESIKRLNAYFDAGADYGWCEFPSPALESAEAIAHGVHAKHPHATLGFNISPSFSAEAWRCSPLTDKILNDLGYKLRFATYPSLVAAARAVYKTALAFQSNAVEGMRNLKKSVEGSPTEIVNEMVDLQTYQAREVKYDPQAFERLLTTEGFGAIKK